MGYIPWITIKILLCILYISILLIIGYIIINLIWRTSYDYLLLLSGGTLCPLPELGDHILCIANPNSSDPKFVEKKVVNTESQDEPSSLGDSTDVAGAENQDNNISRNQELKSLGGISLDFSKIQTGFVIIMAGRTPILCISLHWILANLSRNSRKTLAKWLNQKDLGDSPWLMVNPNSSLGSGVGIIDTPTSEVASAENTSNVSTSRGVSITPAFHAFMVKLLKCCGLTSINHSNSIFDALRIWLTKNNPALYIQNVNKKGYLDGIKLDHIVNSSVHDLKSRRLLSKSKGSKKSKGTGLKPITKAGRNGSKA